MTCYSLDEAGRGTLAGPVSVGCVSFTLETLEKIKNGEILKGLRDSKKIPEPKRIELRKEIIQYASYFRVSFVSAKFIDRFNINQAIFYGMNRCLPTNPQPFEANRTANEKLHLSTSTHEEKTNRNEDKWLNGRPYLLADGNYKLKITKPIEGYFSLPKGDDLIPSISAASILAKTYRDEYMEKMDLKYPGYGFAKHKGYGTEEHREALIKLGISPIHRLSFCKFLRSEGSEPSLF
ncbi:ribonuclease HII [Leptospira bourretii]|uniref:Ribonuclease n=1 Tax=Leptospira bourretii TaxID=2484962 RepID=A0A4R9IMP0_9LEPT|nr:ribonuclease HII [Leptospira bourretii]TGK84696.1 ribonuclease HII [Leptospira bourretii]TGK90464.1 ribonuclease HII [Leptospira bourretii]TGL21653.1 ribonuclease HII [Leptospira bourretii]TGL27070.1 ribonuclease HII [Leptospira bourretii]